jgi:hypothetical protein
MGQLVSYDTSNTAVVHVPRDEYYTFSKCSPSKKHAWRPDVYTSLVSIRIVPSLAKHALWPFRTIVYRYKEMNMILEKCDSCCKKIVTGFVAYIYVDLLIAIILAYHRVRYIH